MRHLELLDDLLMSDTQIRQELLTTLITLCDDLAWGRPANEDSLYRLTAQGTGPEQLTQLAEAFGMMLVKVEARNMLNNQLIANLKKHNTELEKTKALLAKRNVHLLHAVNTTYQASKVVGQCEAMKHVVAMALSIARRPINTLLLGPTGSGKEVIAKLIHFNSPRCEGPFIAVNCTAIPDSLFESEMFGIEKGVATGVNARKGLIEESSGGTLFLDELADMTLPNQAKLLRVLEEQKLSRVGSSKLLSVDLKIVAATNVALEEAVQQGKFRQDLYYRINVAEIRLPPLHLRGEDVLLLAQVFLNRHCVQMGRDSLTLSTEVKHCFLRYCWPGNVRELNNEMERAAALTHGQCVHLYDLSPRIANSVSLDDPTNPPQFTQPKRASGDDDDQEASLAAPALFRQPPSFNLERSEREIIEKALAHTGGNRTKAAALLGITREGLRKKIQRSTET